MGLLTKIDIGFQRFKSAFTSEVAPIYARDNEGNHTYNMHTERFGILGMLGLGQAYTRPSNNLKYYYANTLFLQDCINLYADFASQVHIMEVDYDGNEVENSEFVSFLNNPNPFQNRTEFIKEMVINCLSQGLVIQWGNFFKNGNIRVNPILYNLDYNNISTPKVNDKYLMTRKEIGELNFVEHLADSKKRKLHLSELAFFYDTIPKNGFGDDGYDAEGFFSPMSRLSSIMPSINTLLNAQSSMEFMTGNNVNKVLSRKSTGDGLAPLDDEQKDDIESKVNANRKYGMTAGRRRDIIATNEDLSVLDLSRDNRKMQMIEMKNSAKEDVRNCLNIPEDFYGSSTYENKQHSEARFVLSQVKTITDNWLREIQNKGHLYFESRGTRLVGKYDHIPSVSETKNTNDNKSFLDKTKALDSALATYGNYKTQTGEKISWKEFVRVSQMNEYLMIQQ